MGVVPYRLRVKLKDKIMEQEGTSEGQSATMRIKQSV